MTDTRLAAPAGSERSASATMPYQPALDGVRALAVIAVVAFHAGAGWATGGYLGVSVFFTLSGYLITTVLLREHETQGRVDLSRFVARRIRRLAPASVATLCVVTALAIAGVGTFAFGTAGHIRWASAHLANWDQLAAGTTYADAVSGADDQSPVLHFWSLAIEEQFYLVGPVMMVAGFAVFGRTRTIGRRLLPVLLAALAMSWAYVAFLALSDDAEAVYLTTGSRVAEILTGCSLAAVLRSRPALGGRAISFVTVPCLLVIAAAVVFTGASNDAWPYRGGLPLFALASAGLLLGLQRPDGLTAVIGSRPLVWVGRRSYGIYLYHWPVFVLIPLDAAGVVPHALRLAGVIALAAISYRWLEQPIRHRSTPAVPTVGAAVAGTALIIGATFLIDEGSSAITAVDEIDDRDRVAVAIRDDVEPIREVDDAVVAGSEGNEGERSVPAETTDSALDPSLSRMVVVGDSTAVALSAGLVDWAEATADDVQIGIAAHGACGLVRGGNYVNETLDSALAMDCPVTLDVTLPGLLDTAPIDLVVVMVSLADTWERSWDGGGAWTLPTDPDHGERVRRDYAAFVDDVIAQGARRVVFVRPPVAYRGGELSEPEPAWSNGSAQVVDAVTVGLATERDDVDLLDLREFVETEGLDRDRSLRPDGIHWTADASARLAASWLGPSLLELSER